MSEEDTASDQPEVPEPAPQSPQSQQRPELPGIGLHDIVAGIQRVRDYNDALNNSSFARLVRNTQQQLRQAQAAMDRFTQPLRSLQSLHIRDLIPELWNSIQALRELSRMGAMQLEDIRTAVESVRNSETVQAMQAIAATVRSLALPINEAAEAVRLQSEFLRSLDLESPLIASLAAGVAQAQRSAVAKEAFEASFAKELLTQLNEASLAPSPEVKGERLLHLLLWLQRKINEYPLKRVAILAWGAILVPVFWIVVSYEYGAWRDRPDALQHSEEMRRGFEQTKEADEEDKERDEKLAAQVDALTKEFLEHKADAEASDKNQTEYGVLKTVVVRLEPRATAAVVNRLQAGSVIAEIDREGQWLYVEYFDYIEAEVKEGWVYKRNLVLIEPNDK